MVAVTLTGLGSEERVKAVLTCGWWLGRPQSCRGPRRFALSRVIPSFEDTMHIHKEMLL